MSKPDRILNTALGRLFTNASGRVVSVLAVVSYVGVGLALRIGLQLPAKPSCE